MHIDEVKKQYDFRGGTILTTPNIFPMIKGIVFPDTLEKARYFPIKKKMDYHIESYERALSRIWDLAKKKMKAVKNRIKTVEKLDNNNLQTIERIAKIPIEYKKTLVAIADKYNLNLSLFDEIVVNPIILSNARFDSRKNLLELNPTYLDKHGMIRIGNFIISEIEKTIIHECGHSFWYNSLSEEERRTWQGFSRFLHQKDLQGDMTQYIVGEKKRVDGTVIYSPYYTFIDDAFISIYARFNTKEDFAESFLYYKISPETLREKTPDKYSFIEDKMESKIAKVDNRSPREVIVSILYDMKDSMSEVSRKHFTEVYNLGRQKGAHQARKTDRKSVV